MNTKLRTTIFTLIVFLAVLHIGGYAEADEIPPENGSGSVVNSGTGATAEEIERQENREQRRHNFRVRVLQTQTQLKNLHTAEQKQQGKRRNYRAECRKEIRRSNRDTRWGITKRCMRIDLEMNLDVLEYEKERVERLPGVTNTFQANSLEKIDNLIDAIEAIIQAIESGVYESEEELHEAKKNLLIKYRMPKWHALIHVRADRMISWIAQILGYIEEILTEEELSELLQSSLEKTALCFEEGEILLESVLNDETYSESKEKFRQAQMHIKSCTALAREANTLRVQENEEDPNSVAEPPLSRRLLRRGLKLLP